MSPPPQYSDRKVLVDLCMVPLIRTLWDAGVWTLGSCCGHNNRHASIVIARPDDVPTASRALAGEIRDVQLITWAEKGAG